MNRFNNGIKADTMAALTEPVDTGFGVTASSTFSGSEGHTSSGGCVVCAEYGGRYISCQRHLKAATGPAMEPSIRNDGSKGENNNGSSGSNKGKNRDMSSSSLPKSPPTESPSIQGPHAPEQEGLISLREEVSFSTDSFSNEYPEFLLQRGAIAREDRKKQSHARRRPLASSYTTSFENDRLNHPSSPGFFEPEKNDNDSDNDNAGGSSRQKQQQQPQKEVNHHHRERPPPLELLLAPTSETRSRRLPTSPTYPNLEIRGPRPSITSARAPRIPLPAPLLHGGSPLRQVQIALDAMLGGDGSEQEDHGSGGRSPEFRDDEGREDCEDRHSAAADDDDDDDDDDEEVTIEIAKVVNFISVEPGQARIIDIRGPRSSVGIGTSS